MLHLISLFKLAAVSILLVAMEHAPSRDALHGPPISVLLVAQLHPQTPKIRHIPKQNGSDSFIHPSVTCYVSDLFHFCFTFAEKFILDKALCATPISIQTLANFLARSIVFVNSLYYYLDKREFTLSLVYRSRRKTSTANSFNDDTDQKPYKVYFATLRPQNTQRCWIFNCIWKSPTGHDVWIAISVYLETRNPGHIQNIQRFHLDGKSGQVHCGGVFQKEDLERNYP